MRDRLLSMFPTGKQEWADAMVDEDAGVMTVIRVLIAAWYMSLKGGPIVRTVMTTLSGVNVIAGLSIATMWALMDDTPLIALGLGLALTVQGGYTLWYSFSGSASKSAGRLMIVGETLAFLVGGGGLLVATVNGIGAVDPEYGPMMVSGLIAAHAAAALYMYAVRDETSPFEPAQV